MSKERITLEMNLMQAVVALAEGNPGAVSAIMELANSAEHIDPDNAFGALGPLLSLDTHGIYGSRIWMLYSDVCKKNVRDAHAVLRAIQLGQISKFDVDRAIDNYGDGIDLEKIMAGVQAQLPDFAAAA